MEAAKAVAIPMDREIIHVIPQEFIVDDQDGIKDPVGMSGVRLEAEVKDSSEAFERRIEQLVTTLERERLDHEVTEGALEGARKEREQMQSDLLRLQMEANRLAVNDDTDDMEFPSRGANAA